MEPKHDGIRISTDAMIALVVTEAENRELAALPSRKEMDEAFNPSPQFHEKMEQLLRSAKSRKRAQQRWYVLRRVAVSVSILITLFSCSMIPVKAVQAAVITTLLEWRDQFMSVVYASDNAEDAGEGQLPQSIELAYVPEGFTLQGTALHTERIFLARYADSTGYFSVRITVAESQAQTQVSIDNEYTSVYSIQLDGRDAIWGISDGGVNTLTWGKEDFVYQISGTVDLKTMIQVAENIKM